MAKRPSKKWTRLEHLPIPTEADWGNYEDDLDQEWAHRLYAGRSNEEVQVHFRNNPVEAASDLRFMPEVAFRYYMLGFRDHINAGEFKDLNASDAASCFIRLALQKLETQPRHIAPIMPALLLALEYVAKNQQAFDAVEDIYGSFYGSFPEIYQKIISIYDEVKDRYLCHLR